MKEAAFDVPVVFFVFNRYETTQKVFEQIRKAKPNKLFVVSDGARENIEGEKEKVLKVRELVQKIDWDCEAHFDFSDVNMGCDRRVESGISWAFQFIDKAIILEDDCLPTQQFFEFCRVMLERYQDNPEIAYISGSSIVRNSKCKFDYFYSLLASTWGWATWKERWSLYGYGTEQFESKRKLYLKGAMSERKRQYWMEDMNKHFEEGSFPWDYVWQVSTAGMLRIVPKENLILNIGFSSDSTHTLIKPKEYYDKVGQLSEQLTHPQDMENNKEYVELYRKRATYHIWNRVILKLRTLCK